MRAVVVLGALAVLAGIFWLIHGEPCHPAAIGTVIQTGGCR